MAELIALLAVAMIGSAVVEHLLTARRRDGSAKR
jgi:hypothetical protein